MIQPLTDEQMKKIRELASLIAQTLVDKKFTREEFAVLLGIMIDTAQKTDKE